jgi:hypothetical protein
MSNTAQPQAQACAESAKPARASALAKAVAQALARPTMRRFRNNRFFTLQFPVFFVGM